MSSAYEKAIEGHIATLNHCRHRRVLLRNALIAVINHGDRNPVEIATEAMELDNKMAEEDPTKEHTK